MNGPGRFSGTASTAGAFDPCAGDGVGEVPPKLVQDIRRVTQR